ncbi:MAG: response regulator [Zhengella sp.]|uniref:response regulator n=1 Tax=Zhengella sp. TaxID=2282762 RepID=UPI001DC424D1|nr:response regulator [Notoacmeibacter sp.]MCC0027756.1 response regulator [Brucellaceae bacterium]
MSRKILAVDDSRTMRLMIEDCLAMAGYEVVTAVDGQDGLSKLDGGVPDVIITDINMPVMDGFAFIEAVRKEGPASRVPILVLTTESSPEKKQRARASGATGWIVKPFMPDKLIAAIERVAH